MPKVSDYELEHLSEESNFQKVRRKKPSFNQKSTKEQNKKKQRQQKIDWSKYEDSD